MGGVSEAHRPGGRGAAGSSPRPTIAVPASPTP